MNMLNGIDEPDDQWPEDYELPEEDDDSGGEPEEDDD